MVVTPNDWQLFAKSSEFNHEQALKLGKQSQGLVGVEITADKRFGAVYDLEKVEPGRCRPWG
jgi:hypothetical protein